jgi:hypothetical protein
LSKHFVEVPLKIASFDKVLRQRIPTKTLRHGLWDSLYINPPTLIAPSVVENSPALPRESDHVLNLAYNILAGGVRLENIEQRP